MLPTISSVDTLSTSPFFNTGVDKIQFPFLSGSTKRFLFHLEE